MSTERTGSILVVEDDEAMRDLLSEELEDAGFEVSAAGGAAAGLEVARSGRFDLVITDLSMPRLSGVTLVRELRSMRPGIPVILCTGFSQGLTEERLSDLGVGAVLMKPVPRARLAGEVRRVLDGIAAP